jgi:hypothetical protein
MDAGIVATVLAYRRIVKIEIVVKALGLPRIEQA